MADEEWQIVQLQNRFYRDGFGKVILITIGYMVSILLLIITAIYIYLNKPNPIAFLVEGDWHVQPSIPLSEPYLSDPDLLQWVSDALQKMFVFDFDHYDLQLKSATKYFTPNGWKAYINQVNNYANIKTMQMNKTFVTAAALGAPLVKDRGTLSGRQGWWVEMPILISYAGYKNVSSQNLTISVLVVRVPTMNNLSGVGIENLIVVKGSRNAS